MGRFGAVKAKIRGAPRLRALGKPPSTWDVAYVSPGRERSFRTLFLSLRRQRRLHRRPLRKIRSRSEVGRRRMAGLLRQPEGRLRRRDAQRARRLVEEAAV